MDAFDADVLIYAAVDAHPLGTPVRALFPRRADAGEIAGLGSVLLLPELLTKPLREGDKDALDNLTALLARLELLPADRAIAQLATALGAEHGLRAADAVHLATAVAGGADRFVTHNRRHFPKSITEIAIVSPTDL